MALNAEVLKVAALINKKHGVGTVVMASEALIPNRITTGSLTLDAEEQTFSGLTKSLFGTINRTLVSLVDRNH